MIHYFKTEKDSETYKAINAVLTKWNEFNALKNKFCEDYNVHKISYSQFFLCAVDSVHFKELPNNLRDNWKKSTSEKSGWYQLKAYPKDLKLKERWEELKDKRVKRNEIDSILGSKDPFQNCGVNFSNNEFYIFEISDISSYNIPSDCIEISNIEYEKLCQKKS